MSKISRRTALTRCGKAVAAAAVLPVILNPTAEAAQGDAELVSMWHDYRAQITKLNAALHRAEEGDALFAQASELVERILVTQARTPAGIAVKLKIAEEYESLEKDVRENPQLVMPRAVLSALADAERLAGRA